MRGPTSSTEWVLLAVLALSVCAGFYAVFVLDLGTASTRIFMGVPALLLGLILVVFRK
jgi:hypothetical protein